MQMANASRTELDMPLTQPMLALAVPAAAINHAAKGAANRQALGGVQAVKLPHAGDSHCSCHEQSGRTDSQCQQQPRNQRHDMQIAAVLPPAASDNRDPAQPLQQVRRCLAGADICCLDSFSHKHWGAVSVDSAKERAASGVAFKNP